MTTQSNSPRLHQRKFEGISSRRVSQAGNFNSGQDLTHTHTPILDISSC